MNYYFIGIKGSGMAALAEILKQLGNDVRGSDIEKFIFTQQQLTNCGIAIDTFEYDDFTNVDTFVVGNAFSLEHPQVLKALATNKPVIRYHECLGLLMEKYQSISIAGTHGKTTTTGLVAQMLAKIDKTGYLIGDGTGELANDSKYFVVESCEYKRHFLKYFPDYAIITSAELDHVDYYNGMDDYLLAYEQFSNNVKKGLVIFGDDENVMKLKLDKPFLTYGLKKHNDVQARNVVYDEKGINFDLYVEQNYVQNIQLPFAGEHLLWNALAALSLVLLAKLPIELAIKGLQGFSGVKRRFNTEVLADHVYIDDYAHHPTAIRLTIAAAKQKYPNKKIVAIFKPDRYSRIAYFVDEFAKSFAAADTVLICDFPQNTAKEPGIDFKIEELVEKIDGGTLIAEDETTAKDLAKAADTVFLMMSSKDIYKFKDLIKLQKEQLMKEG